MPDVIAWDADEAEEAVLQCGFQVNRVIMLPFKPIGEGVKYWRVVRQRLLDHEVIELVVAPITRMLSIS